MPSGLSFLGFPDPATQLVGTPVGTSTNLSTALYNTGTTGINISDISISGDYSQSNTCAATLAPAESCSLNVTFTPTASGTRNGAITIADDAPGSPHIIPLTGVGLTAAVSLSAPSLIFQSQVVGTSSTTQSETLTNSGGASLNISRIEISGDFAETNNCGTFVNVAGNCTISVTFNPIATGTRTGVLTITDDATGSPQTINLTGTAVAANLGLGIPNNGSNSATVQAGGSASYSLALGGEGLSGTVNLSCTGAPTTVTCNVPATANISASTASTITVTVSTTARSSASVGSHHKVSWAFAFGIIGILFLPGSPSWSRKLRNQAHVFAISLLLLMCSCGGGSSSNPPPTSTGTQAGTYILTVTASMGAATQSTALTLTVR
jgi:hypothetical protein